VRRNALTHKRFGSIHSAARIEQQGSTDPAAPIRSTDPVATQRSAMRGGPATV
jgi:hypothetical protein